MGKIGNYEYPDHDIEEAADIVETIDEYDITKHDLLAEKLGHSSAEGGAFRNKVTSLKRYGLLTGRGEIALTDRGEKVATPYDDQEERTALGSAVESINLFRRLYDRLDGEPPDDDLWYHLVELTDVDRSEAKEKAPRIQRLYSAGHPYLREVKESEDEGRKEEAEKDDQEEDISLNESGTSTDVDAKVITQDYGQIKVKDKDTLAVARQLLDLLDKEYSQTEDE